MGTLLEIAKTCVSPCEKLIDAVQKAIGKAYEPKHIRKMADAKAYEISTIGQAIRGNIDIPIAYEKGDISLDMRNFEEFVKRTENRLAYQELLKQNNIENVANQAYLLLDDCPPVDDEPLETDWILRFFNSVQDVSNIEMQKLWAKILAREVLMPGSVSLRTLTVLAQMQAGEAQLFEKVAKYVLRCKNKPSTLPDDCFILSDADFLDKINLSFAEIFVLDELGLLSYGSLFVEFDVCPQTSEYISYRGTPIIEIKNTGSTVETVSHSAYILTSTGRELLQVVSDGIDNQENMQDYFRQCMEFIESKKTTLEFLLVEDCRLIDK